MCVELLIMSYAQLLFFVSSFMLLMAGLPDYMKKLAKFQQWSLFLFIFACKVKLFLIRNYNDRALCLNGLAGKSGSCKQLITQEYWQAKLMDILW